MAAQAAGMRNCNNPQITKTVSYKKATKNMNSNYYFDHYKFIFAYVVSFIAKYVTVWLCDVNMSLLSSIAKLSLIRYVKGASSTAK